MVAMVESEWAALKLSRSEHFRGVQHRNQTQAKVELYDKLGESLQWICA